MSKRRKKGDWVLVSGVVGFVQLNKPRKAQIVDDYHQSCFVPRVDCDDPDCREWGTLITEDGIVLCHVSECGMKDISEGDIPDFEWEDLDHSINAEPRKKK